MIFTMIMHCIVRLVCLLSSAPQSALLTLPLKARFWHSEVQIGLDRCTQKRSAGCLRDEPNSETTAAKVIYPDIYVFM